VLTYFARPTQDGNPQSRPISNPSAPGNAINPAESSGVESQNTNCQHRQTPYSDGWKQEQVHYRSFGSQQPMATPGRVKELAIHSVGAQFDHQQLPPSHSDLIKDITIATDYHHYRPTSLYHYHQGFLNHHHQASLYHVDNSGNIVQAPRYSNLRPTERFLLEASTQQQPAVFVKPFAGQPSTHGGCWHNSSTSRK
jgi:hypothetical protein